jgi:hypothetical protein
MHGEILLIVSFVLLSKRETPSVICVLLFMNELMSPVLIAMLILLGSKTNSRFCKSMFHHCVASAECLIISASYLCFSLCHQNNFDSFLFANQHFKRGILGKYQNTFFGPPFLLLQLSSSPPSFLRLNWSTPQVGHFSRSSYLDSRYRMQSFLTRRFFSTYKPNRQIIYFAS